MIWSNLHTEFLNKAFENILGEPSPGNVAYVTCLKDEIVYLLAEDKSFSPNNWEVFCVSNEKNIESRIITADNAVELRENKDMAGAVLFLVDTDRAGAGMDGIYNAAREIDETTLFNEAINLVKHEITRKASKTFRSYAEKAVKRAKGYGQRFHIPPLIEYDFYITILNENKFPGELLYKIGLWPIKEIKYTDEKLWDNDLSISQFFINRLLSPTVSGLSPNQRIESLNLVNPDQRQISDLEQFLREASAMPLLKALEKLYDKEHLWINLLLIESNVDNIQSIELIPWRNNKGRIQKWSGLIEGKDEEEFPKFILKPDANKTGEYSKLEIRWKTKPNNLEKGSVIYRVTITTDMDEELVYKDVIHSGPNKDQKCRFTNDDFDMLNEDTLITAKVLVSVLDKDKIEPQESEEFNIQFGDITKHEKEGIGREVRTFSEGVIELDGWDEVTELVSMDTPLPINKKGFVIQRTKNKNKVFRVFCPPLIKNVEEQWIEKANSNLIGRWKIKVRASGERVTSPEFIPINLEGLKSNDLKERLFNANRRFADLISRRRSVGMIYDQRAKTFENNIKEYLLSWAAIFENEHINPSVALANTIEVQSLSGRTVGLIVLPLHPIRVAWHIAYDNLVLYAAFEEKIKAKDIRKDFAILDGAMFPAFLPGLTNESCFVFADTLGFHCIGMVPDYDKEPKASVAILARALGNVDSTELVPTIGMQSSEILSNEIIKYLKSHNTSRIIKIHSLKPGDGLTIARALGKVIKKIKENTNSDEEDIEKYTPIFQLELYPSKEQKEISGRFISEVREKRRKGAGISLPEDNWMLESVNLQKNLSMPRLRWAKKDDENPNSAAHLAVAFDIFESHTISGLEEDFALKERPYFAFGLLSFFERQYETNPLPTWHSYLPNFSKGDKHPADKTHTDRLMRIKDGVQKCVAKFINAKDNNVILLTEISQDKSETLRNIHHLCDWVITLDRNAGIEYFDSPRDNKEIYDAYIIDCVPEREDLGCLQLITSTSNLEEVRILLDSMLDQMGLSRSRRNAEFLLEHLKALSGRLAIRLTGQKIPSSELIALALSYANSLISKDDDKCWISLNDGFLIPVDDIIDLLPPLNVDSTEEDERKTRPDLIYVSYIPRRGLYFNFIEVKYRKHLRDARSPETLNTINHQIKSIRQRWDKWYTDNNISPTLMALRRAKLARVLKFYADKARRHANDIKGTGLSGQKYTEIINEIDRMLERGKDYNFSEKQEDRGWVFCPEYQGLKPSNISPPEWETKIFIFGPWILPDSNITDESLKLEIVDNFTKTEQHEGDTIANIEKGNESDETVFIHLGTDLYTETDIKWPLTIIGNPHLLIAGLPGMGKTTCLLNICKQMVLYGIKPIIFSYHQDIDDRLKDLVGSVRFLDYHGLDFNPLQVIDRESKKAYLDVAGAIRDIFIAIFPELGNVQGERIRKAIKESFIEVGWDDPTADLKNLREPDFKRFLEILRSEPKPDRGLQNLLTRLDELDDYNFFDLSENRTSIWDSDGVTVIRIHATQNENLQKALASLIFYGLYKNMFRRGIQKRITHAIFFDEAHRAARLKLIPTMAKECRKYGISLVLASQEAKDFNPSLFSAIANYLVLRLNEVDAKALVRNVASSDQERTLIDKIKQIEKFKALYFTESKKKPTIISLLNL